MYDETRSNCILSFYNGKVWYCTLPLLQVTDLKGRHTQTSPGLHIIYLLLKLKGEFHGEMPLTNATGFRIV